MITPLSPNHLPPTRPYNNHHPRQTPSPHKQDTPKRLSPLTHSPNTDTSHTTPPPTQNTAAKKPRTALPHTNAATRIQRPMYPASLYARRPRRARRPTDATRAARGTSRARRSACVGRTWAWRLCTRAMISFTRAARGRILVLKRRWKKAIQKMETRLR